MNRNSPVTRYRKFILLLTIGLVGLNLTWRVTRYALNFPIWNDEAMAVVNILDLNFTELLDPRQHICKQVAPLGFYLAQRAIGLTTSMSDWGLRILPTLAGFGSLLLFFRFSRRLASPREALLAVAIFAASQYPVRHAAEFKPYSFDLLASLLILNLGFDLHSHIKSPLRWAAMAIVGAVSIWFSITAVFVGVAVSGWLLLPALRQKSWIPVVGLIAVLAALSINFLASLYLYLIPLKLETAHYKGMSMWTVGFPPLDRPWRIPDWLIRIHSGRMMAYPHGEQNFGSVLTFIYVVLGAIRLARSPSRRHVCWLLLAPALVGLAASFAHAYPYGGTVRTNLYQAPSICILAGVGLWWSMRLLIRCRRRNTALILVASLMAAIACGGFIRDILKPYKEPGEAETRAAIAQIGRATPSATRWAIANAIYVNSEPSGLLDVLPANTAYYLELQRPDSLILTRVALENQAHSSLWLLHFEYNSPLRLDGRIDNLLDELTQKRGKPRLLEHSMGELGSIFVYQFDSESNQSIAETPVLQALEYP